MAVVDWAYYSSVYMGEEATSTEFPALEARAEDVIGAMTRWAVTADTIANLPDLHQTLYKKAICAQVDYFALNGFESAVSGADNGFTVGKVSIHGRTEVAGAGNGKLAASIAPLAIMYLEQTGLMNPQVLTVPQMPVLGGWF
jgi:hypothetical protein